MNGANIGVEYSSNPARLVAQSGQFMVENIREIGKQVQGTILELNTRKDLGRMVQDLQGLNVQSNEFPIQAAQVFASHPLAAQDPRGQLALGALGKAHSNWQELQQAQARYSDLMNVPGVGAVRKSTGEVVAGIPSKPVAVGPRSRVVDPATGTVIVNALPEPEALVSTPGGPMNRGTGLDPQGNPIVIPQKGAMTEYQRAQLGRASKKDRIDMIQKEVNEIDQNFASAERNYKMLLDDENKTADEIRKLGDEADPQLEVRRKKLEEQKTYVGKLADDLRAKKEQRMKDLKAIELEVEDVIGTPAPDLIPAGAVAPPPATDDLVAVFNPAGEPKKIRRSQLNAALQNGYKQR